MEVQRLPRQLFYRWTEGGEEIEYPDDLPDPAPEITCDTVQITVPPALPGVFHFYVSQPFIAGQQNAAYNFYLFSRQSWFMPVLAMRKRYGNPADPYCFFTVTTYNQFGQPRNDGGNPGFASFCGSLYMTPGSTQQPRRDLLVGTDRLINPTINAPCPTWRLAGGNCPPNSLDCGNCCLDCSALNTAINGLTSTVLPYSSWRPR